MVPQSPRGLPGPADPFPVLKGSSEPGKEVSERGGTWAVPTPLRRLEAAARTKGAMTRCPAACVQLMRHSPAGPGGRCACADAALLTPRGGARPPGQVKVTPDSSPAGRPGGPYELAGGSCEGRPSRLTAGRPLVWDTEMSLQGQGAPVALEQ
ncbi:unnamed protein product [Rangifer tarandus platyrhynchus]|uniref:Uncharacterized protein n=2 Tax=Rangifer tarandus platyrhynchus TaxID=3082113 RepID=A0ABN8YVV8_RANTA|nr:unnamed protein product [Rangifer tarandus platyrhynchus]CAI9693648.1 unnamed protein product [Rangifer tarandus platyrhynchus]